MSYHFALMVGFGMVVFTVGALTRTYMNAVIRRSSCSDGSGTRSTELRYWRLVKKTGCSSLAVVDNCRLYAAWYINCFYGCYLEQSSGGTVKGFMIRVGGRALPHHFAGCRVPHFWRSLPEVGHHRTVQKPKAALRRPSIV